LILKGPSSLIISRSNSVGSNKSIVRRNNPTNNFVQNDVFEKGSRERSLYNEDCECDRSAIDHHSAVDRSCLAAVHKNLLQKQIGRQEHAVECTPVHMMERLA
jgi:hypothetical protein